MDPAVTYDMAVEARSVTKTFVGEGDDVTALDAQIPKTVTQDYRARTCSMIV